MQHIVDTYDRPSMDFCNKADRQDKSTCSALLAKFAATSGFRNPSTLEVPRRLAAFQRRPPVDVVRMQTGFARSWALERIAADSGVQIRQISEHVRLPAKFVGNHWRLDGNRGDDRDSNTASLQGFDQRTEISVAGEKHDVIDAVGKLHRID